MPTLYRRSILLAASLVLSASFPPCMAAEKTVAEWADLLANDSPAVRQQAAIALLAAGGAAEPLIEQLTRSPDPWVAARAGRLMMRARGIDPRLPLDLQQAVSDFPKQPLPEQSQILSRLAIRQPGALETLVLLHSRSAPSTADDQRIWHRYLLDSLRSNHHQAVYPVVAMSTATRARVISLLATLTDPQIVVPYTEWRKLDERLPSALDERGIAFELKHQRDHGTPMTLLELAGQVADRTAQKKVFDEIQQRTQQGTGFPAGEMSEAASLGYLEFLAAQQDRGIAEWYATQIERHPGLATRLRGRLLELEVIRLRKLGKISDAVKAAMHGDCIPPEYRYDSLPEELGKWLAEHPWYRYDSVPEELGKWLAEHPDALPDGLPPIADPRALPRQGALLYGFERSTRVTVRFGDPHPLLGKLDSWVKSDDWLEAARKHGPVINLYHQMLARRSRLADAVFLHERDGESRALALLGEWLRFHPELAAQIPVRRCDPSTLRHMLDGAMGSNETNLPDALAMDDLATAWAVEHPGLMDDSALLMRPVYQAMRDWRTGGTGPAAEALLRLVSAPAEQVRTERNDFHTYPTGDIAMTVLADLLVATPDIGLETIIGGDHATAVVFERLIGRLARAPTVTERHVRLALALTKLGRSRFPGNAKIVFRLAPYDACESALKSWRAGDETAAYQLMLLAFVSHPDPEERYDPLFVEFAACTGRLETALDDFETFRPSMEPSVFGAKRARLLRALGRPEEALQCAFPDPQPLLWRDLQIECGHWKAAIDSIRNGESINDERRRTMQACLAILSGDADLVKRHTATGNRMLDTLQGALPPADNGLRALARDSELAARHEAALIKCLATGEPPPFNLMSEYLRFPDTLPDRARTIRIARELGLRPTCEIDVSSAIKDRSQVSHKVVAAEALLRLGRGELAFEVMRAIVESTGDWRQFPAPEKYGFGGYTQPVLASYRMVVRIAEAEWPDAKPEARAGNLAAILGNPKAGERARTMIALIAKHQQTLTNPELLQALWLPLFDLARVAAVPGDLKTAATKLVMARNPTDHEQRWLHSLWAPIPDFLNSPATGQPQPPQPPDAKLLWHPPPGKRSDPRSDDFTVLDGIAAVKARWDAGDRPGSTLLLREIMIRLLLDSKLDDQGHEMEIRSSGWSSKQEARPAQLIILHCFDGWKMDPELIEPCLGACWRTWTNYSASKRFLLAGRCMAKAGKLREAITLYRLYLMDALPRGSDTGIVETSDMAELFTLQGVLAASTGDDAGAVANLRRVLLLTPYTPARGHRILAALRARNSPTGLTSAQQAIDDYWRAKLVEIPDSKTYQDWHRKWRNP